MSRIERVRRSAPAATRPPAHAADVGAAEAIRPGRTSWSLSSMRSVRTRPSVRSLTFMKGECYGTWREPEIF